MSRRFWAAHGLIVQSDDIDLAARSAHTEARPDVTVVAAGRGQVPAPDEHADGRHLAHLERAGVSWLTVAENGPSGAVDIHFHGVATAAVSADRSLVVLTLAPSADEGYAPVLMAGTVLAVLLVLRGHPVLHASAVVTGTGRRRAAIGFVGSSGMGKSTLATLCCRDGATLVTDDILRVDDPTGGAVVWPGSTATRLRNAAVSLGHQASATTALTADGRTATTLHSAGEGPFPLRAIVIPHPDRSAEVLELIQLSQWDAMLTLLRFPRIPGWTDRATSTVMHEHLGALAGSVPVAIARVPWGPPFRSGLGTEILDAVDSLPAPRGQSPL